VMPYVEGESLRARLVREKLLPVSDAVRIATEVAGALDYAHRHGVVHRDIKPENILLQEGRALVADFGIALAVQHAGGNRMTRTGISLGTPQYMSPEQAMGEREVTSRSDIYALGCVTYEMLVGEPPFSGPNAQAILARMTTEEPRPISPERKTVPPHVETAVLTALARLPADRFATAAEFAAPLARDRRRPGKETRPSARARTLPFGLAAATVLALGWGGWEAARRRSEPAPPIAFTIPAELAPNLRGNLIAFSPDGRKLVFVETVPGTLRSRLVFRRLDRTDAQVLAGTDGAGSPFFSPDGEWVGFSQGSRLRKIRSDGRDAITIADLGPSDQAGRASWGLDRSIVFGTRNARVYRVPAEGGALKRIPLPDSAGYTGPIWLPDRGDLLVTRKPVTGQEMAVISAETGKVERVLGRGQALQYVEPGFIVYLSPENALTVARYDRKERKLLAASSTIARSLEYVAGSLPIAVASNGSVAYAPGDWTSKELVLVTAEGGTTLLPLGTQAFRRPRFSPDGQRIAVGEESGGDLVGDIKIFTRGAETFTRLTFEGSSVFPEWTPDGKGVLYSTHARNELGGLYRIPADQSGLPARLTGSARYVYEGVLNPRQDTLLYRANNKATGRDIMLLPIGGTPVPFAASDSNEYSPTISPDGRLVLFASEESGRVEVYLRPLGGGGRVQVSSHGGNEPRWGPGGREAYYWMHDTLFAVPITRTPHPAAGARRAVLSGKYVREAVHANYDIAPEGNTFVMIRQASGNTTAVTVLLNWFQTLKP